MAQTFSYTFKSKLPQPTGMHDATYPGTSLYWVELTGPASSVSDGMLIGSATTDFSVIVGLCEIAQGNKLYKLRFSKGTANSAATGKVIVDRCSTGKPLSGATNLASVKWDVFLLGRGPNASAIS